MWLISSIGYSAIEILCDTPHAYPPGEQDVKKIKALLSRNNLGISNLNAFTMYAVWDTYRPSWVEDASKLRQLRVEHTKNCIVLASKLGCRNISTEPGGPKKRRSQYVSRSRFVKEMNVISRFAEAHGIKVLVEPEPGLLLETSDDFLSFIKEVESEYIRLNFDIAHFYCSREDPAKAVHKLSDFIEHVHLSDIAMDRVHNHLIPGDGTIDFKSVLKAIASIGYKGFVTVELYPYQNAPLFAATKAFEFLKRLELDL